MARIVLKSDFDGVVSAMLLRSVVVVEEVVFAHPEDVLSGIFKLTEQDYVLNLPVFQKVAAHFTDHVYPIDEQDFLSENSHVSCSEQVVAAYPQLSENKEAAVWLRWVNDFNGGKISKGQIETPPFHLMVGFLMDPLTGMGKRKDFLKSNTYFLLDFIETGLKKPVDEWETELDLLDRIQSFEQDRELYRNFVIKHAKIINEVIVLDKRNEERMPLGNRFDVFVVFPRRVALYLYHGKGEGMVVVTAVASPFYKRSTHIGNLFKAYGGYGDAGYGTLQLEESGLESLMNQLTLQLEATL